ncbi:Pleckstrin homology domain-containing protein [Mycena metata]|uniref:Pleckstrin homology domain-containing protein n=1 Tax=Mycena metata TaxID=1033252 RepID=A0AAD7KFQ2_9AGAR|nr:Pleckstrin homology domain-containing protein [Mycena metata]
MSPPPIPTIVVEPADTLPIPPPLTQSSTSRSKAASENAAGPHAHRRVFIGPMPEKVVPMNPAPKDKKRRHFRAGSTDGDDDDNISKIIREHAFAFFIQEGGNEEDWGREGAEPRSLKQAKKWIGGSFEVGDILGVNILHEPAESIRDRMSMRSDRTSNRSARSPRRPGMVLFLLALASPRGRVYRDDLVLHPEPRLDTAPPSGRRAQSDFAARPVLESSAPAVKSDTHVPVIAKQRERAVHYADPPTRETGSGAESPAPPSEVLERSSSELPGTSAEAMSTTREVPWGEVVMRDRMLVRIGYTKSESLGPVFDEEQSRKTRGIRYDEWAEYIVFWRKDYIHFYEPHNVPGTKWLTGSKYRLAFVVPLKSQKTRLSLYSFVDLTFCLTCPPASYHSPDSKARAVFRRTKEGTHIFICKVKSRSRAADWMWRRLGGLLPPTLEIRNPSLGTRVRIEMPGIEAPEMFTRENIISLCLQSLRRVQDWKDLIETELSGGKELELAWRLGTQLDWVWLDTDVQGQQRDCAVLCGLAMQQSFPSPHLEVRLGQHSAQHFPEPPAIEGYLERIRSNSQNKHLIYLVTHDGNLFSLASEDANPPAPMGIGQSADTPEALRLAEVQRGSTQILKATGVSDMRAILAVRRAFQPVVPASHDTHDPGEDQSFLSRTSHIERTDSDDEDEGGEEGLRAARSFELLLKNGHIIRFEAHSRKVAVEWIERLQALVGYWKQRHRIDANEEMDLAQAYRPRLTPRRHVMRNDSQIAPEAPVDTSAPLPALGNLYSWCVLQGCKPVIRGGKVFIRQGLYGQYKFVQLILLPGHLAQFQIKPQSSLHLAMHKSINLADAYVCSGYFAALTLPDGQYSSENVLPRRYQDGLETDDADEDTMFMLWLPDGEDNAKPRADAPRLPSLSSKRKLAVVRCRNKLERDAWCWALNSEIEKIVRIQQDREDKLRNTGGSLRS